MSLLAACIGGADAGSNSGGDAQTATDGSSSGEVSDDVGGGDAATGDASTADSNGGDVVGADADDSTSADTADTAVSDAEDAGPDTAGLDCPGGAGCACSGNSDCDNGICIDTPDGKRCAEKCVDTCKNGYSCKQFGDSDVVFACLPGYLSLCSPCQSKSDCSYQGVEALCQD